MKYLNWKVDRGGKGSARAYCGKLPEIWIRALLSTYHKSEHEREI